MKASEDNDEVVIKSDGEALNMVNGNGKAFNCNEEMTMKGDANV